MKIGIVSPFMPHDLADLLDANSQKLLREIRGVLATPVTPIARVWHQRGHNISIFCLDPSVEKEQILRGEQLVIHVLPKRRARYYLFDCYRAERRLLRDAIRREEPDVLSAQWSYEHALAALQSRIPTAVTCHDSPLHCAWVAKDFYTTYHTFIAWRVIRSAKRLVCVSPYIVEHIKKHFAPQGQVDMVPNGIPAKLFERRERRLATTPDQAEQPFVICSAGGWGPLKNIPTLLKAFNRVFRANPEARLKLFGRELGADQAAERWAKHNRLQEGVSFGGGVSREAFLDFLETKTDLMVHPSLVESFGMTLVEAMACGVPVVGGEKSGAVAWTLEDGNCGYLCDVRNEVALADTMTRAMHAPDQNRALVSHAWSSAKNRFNIERVAAANEEILKQLAGSSYKQ
jgi:glycosyltransferase involved in cell wall biosynthesis